MSGPIRILQVFGALNRGGAESMIMNLYRAIDRSKIQFDFVKHTSSPCAFDEEINSLGGVVYCAPKFKIYNYFSYKKWWNNFFKQHPEYKVVHGHLFSIASIFFKEAHKYKCRTIGHSHSAKVSIKSIKQFFRQPFLKSLPKYSDYCFACAQAAGAWIFKGKQFTVLNNAIDSEKFLFSPEARNCIRNEFNLQKKFVLGNVGRLTLQKNQEFLIDVFAEIHKKEENSVLMIVGVGELNSHLKDKVRSLELDKSVVFTGARADVPALLSAMDVFVFPSLWEGLPVTVIEAQAAGLPIVCSDSVTKEVVVTDLVEMLPLSQSAEAWATSVLQKKNISRNADVKEKIVAAGYDIHTTARWLEMFYGKISRS